MRAARAALHVLHEAGVEAHVTRISAPRRHRYCVAVGDAGRLAAPASDRPCCVRSRLRGAFLFAGRVSRPGVPPHLEIACPDQDASDEVAGWLDRLELRHQTGVHAGRWRVLVRGGGAVADTLTCIGAQTARLEFEEGQVVREVSGGVNRALNGETANLRRTADAGLRQLEAARALTEAGLWDGLPHSVREAAELRRRHPADALWQLAEAAGCSRSAMAGRLHRLVAEAARVTGAGC